MKERIKREAGVKRETNEWIERDIWMETDMMGVKDRKREEREKD